MKILSNLLKMTTLILGFGITNNGSCTQNEYNLIPIGEIPSLNQFYSNTIIEKIDDYKNTETYKIISNQRDERNYGYNNKEKYINETNMHHTNKKIRSDTSFHKYD